MSRLATTTLLAAVLATAAAGCGGAKTSAHTRPSTTSTTPSSDPAVALDRAVRTALQENSRLSLYTLWHNALPSWAEHSTRGPALAELRSSAAQRRNQGIQIRHLSGRLHILSVSLDPSYERATAIVRANDRLQPFRAGRPLGRVIIQNERARVELRRLGRSQRFVVWKVGLAR
jgi:hypothetical protein